MKSNVLLIICISLLLIRCDNKPKECDDFGPFEESWIVGKYNKESDHVSSNNTVIIEDSGKVTIYTNIDSTNFTREGILEYRIINGPDCICAGGYDIEYGCRQPSSIYTGLGTITITSTNDSICNVDILRIDFTSYFYKTVLEISDGNCINLHLEKRLGYSSYLH